MKKIIGIFCLLIVLSGCIATTSNLYVDKPFAPTAMKQVRVFKEMPTDRNFTKIGEITVDDAKDWSSVEGNLKKEGSKIGADAVYIVDSSTRTKGMISGGAYGVSGFSQERYTVTGVAIKYND